MSQAVAQVVEGLKASMTDGSTVSINGRPVRLINVSDTKARLELGWRVSPSTTIHLKVEPPGGEPIVMKSRVVSARVATVKDGTITYSAEVMVESLTSPGAQSFTRASAPTAAAAGSAAESPASRTAEAAPPAVSLPADPANEHSSKGSGTHGGLDAALAKRELQEELTASRTELAAERERRERGEEQLNEFERRYAQQTEAYE